MVKELGVAIAKMLLLKTITSLLTGGFGGAASSVVPIASSMPGTWGGNPSLGKTAYNPTFVFENTIEGQKILLKGVKERSSILR